MKMKVDLFDSSVERCECCPVSPVNNMIVSRNLGIVLIFHVDIDLRICFDKGALLISKVNKII